MNDASRRQLILIVDDVPDNIDVLGGVLRRDYNIKVALDGQRALRIAVTEPRPDLILLDIMMPGIDGYEVCRRLKENPVTSDIPVMFITAKDDSADEEHGFELGAVDYITKPISPSVVRARVRTHLSLYDQQRLLAEQVHSRTSELNTTRLEIIRRLGRAAEYRDNETGNHVIRMSHSAKLIAQAHGSNPEWTEMLFNAAPMHDIGKIGVSDLILLKPGKLDADEWSSMMQHTSIGAEIIGDNPNPLLQMARTIALTHHEKWDGSGYPQKLAGEEIPLEGRICAIADVFDALTSVRPYKKAWSVEDATRTIKEGSGSHFDPQLVPLFLDVLPEVLNIRETYFDTE